MSEEKRSRSPSPAKKATKGKKAAAPKKEKKAKVEEKAASPAPAAEASPKKAAPKKKLTKGRTMVSLFFLFFFFFFALFLYVHGGRAWGGWPITEDEYRLTLACESRGTNRFFFFFSSLF